MSIENTDADADTCIGPTVEVPIHAYTGALSSSRHALPVFVSATPPSPPLTLDYIFEQTNPSTAKNNEEKDEISRLSLPLRLVREFKDVQSPQGAQRAREKVRKMCKYAWDSYALRCFGQDELLAGPLRQMRCGHWFGLGATIIDSLSTLYLLGT